MGGMEAWERAYEKALELKKRAMRDMLWNRVLFPLDAHLSCAYDAVRLAGQHLPDFAVTYAYDRPLLMGRLGQVVPEGADPVSIIAQFYGDVERYPDVYESPNPNVKSRVLPEVQRFEWVDLDYDEGWSKPMRETLAIQVVLRGTADGWSMVEEEPDYSDNRYGYKKFEVLAEKGRAEYNIYNPSTVYMREIGRVQVQKVRAPAFLLELMLTYQGTAYPVTVEVYSNPEIVAENVVTGDKYTLGGGTVVYIGHQLPSNVASNFDVIFAGCPVPLPAEEPFTRVFWHHVGLYETRGLVKIGENIGLAS